VDLAAQVSKKMQEFAAEVYPAILGTTRTDGSVQVVPVWFEYRDGSFWVNGGTNRGWFKHLQREPRVTLLLLDPKDMFRWAQVEGRMVKWAEDPGGEHINNLSHRYTGKDYQNSREGRIKIQIEPTRITGSIDGWR
jgi:PPOX class probable F420-dependent enzyme